MSGDTDRPIRSGSVAFAPRARLLKLIGAELISDDVLAVTELVKNAHDADAKAAWVEFEGVTGADGTITVRDDGDGMGLETLLRGWMEPAGTLKAHAKGRRTRTGRRVLGEKGVGRFAADKLGRRLELVSRARGSSREVRAVFDWDDFDRHDVKLADVKSRWELRRAQEIEGSGTILRISGLRVVWNERMFRRLSSRLARLRPPLATAEEGFDVWIESDEFPDYSGSVETAFLDRSPYRVEACFDGSHALSMKVNGGNWQEYPWHDAGILQCGPVKLSLFAFDLDDLPKVGPKMVVRAWLRAWSGISIYRDGFRVWPYGEPDDDWLRLDQRRVNAPTLRLSNNQVVGFVEITRDANPDLVDQTNRQGLMHNEALDHLRRLVYFVLQTIESERQRLRHPRGDEPSTSNGRPLATDGGARSALEALTAHGTGGQRGKKLVADVRRAIEQGVIERARLREGYAELAAVGQSALEFSTAARPLLERARDAAERLGKNRSRNGQQGRADEMADLLESLDAVAVRLVAMEIIDAGTAYRSRYTDLRTQLEVFADAIRPVLGGRAIALSLHFDTERRLVVTLRPETIHRLLHVLVANSMDWLHRVRLPKLRITVKDRGDGCTLEFADNGPGIPRGLVDRVFDPLFSTKEGGRGMGLTIARELVEQHKGRIRVVHDGRRRGATIRIDLPTRKTRKRS